MNEEDVLKRIYRYSCGRMEKNEGMGDDAAVLRFKKNENCLITTDALREKIHFKWDWISPKELAYRILAVNFSDLAAMGASPVCVFLSLYAPSFLEEEKKIKEFLLHFGRHCDRFGVRWAGGDTDMGVQKKWHISLTAMGVCKGKILCRDGLQAGDDLWLSGPLGMAAAGLFSLRHHQVWKKLEKKWRCPNPRIKLANRLGKLKGVHACMDISDGFSLDLHRMLRTQGLGAEIRADLFHISPVFYRYLKKSSSIKKCLPCLLDCGFGLIEHWVLYGGEDYELLIACDKKLRSSLEKLHCVRIGRVTARRGVWMKTLKNEKKKLKPQGWIHGI